MTIKRIVCAMAAMVMAVAPGDENTEQVNEANVVFDSTKPRAVREVRGGSWKVVYSSAQGPHGRALQTLTERLGNYFLRTMHYSTALVLPLEKAGGPVVKTKHDMIIVGELADNPVMAKYVKAEDIPEDGYLIRTFHENEHNVVILAGDGPEETLYATFHFLDVIAPDLERGLGAQAARYAGTFFRTDKVPEYTYRTAPQTKIRSIFSWGHVIDDYNETFRALARARFNRAILWNDQLVVNAKDVVDNAHSWGVQVYWGFSWGWTLSGKDGPVDFDKLADEIVDEWRSKWKGMGGDGIYFQSFTETGKKQIGGRAIPDAVVELVAHPRRGARNGYRVWTSLEFDAQSRGRQSFAQNRSVDRDSVGELRRFPVLGSGRQGDGAGREVQRKDSGAHSQRRFGVEGADAHGLEALHRT